VNLLDKIIANKKKELVELIKLKPVKELEHNKYFTRGIIPLTESILSPGKTGIIAEFKRKSPSQGILNNQVDIGIVTTGYAREGASGLSVLTDHEFFGGDINDLMLVRKLNSIPLLRKDFIIDEYQVIESKAAGADVILLIAAIIPENQILKLAHLARSIGLQVLMEVHNVTEIQMVNEYVNIIGVNNRDLRTFKIDTKLSFELADKIPGDFVKISESGISSFDTIIKLKKAGYQGFLIGEKFMKDKDPVFSFAELTRLLRGYAEN